MNVDLSRRSFTMGQVAKILGIANNTAQRLVDNKHLRGAKLPGTKQYRVGWESLLAYMEQAPEIFSEQIRKLKEAHEDGQHAHTG